jgi:acetyl-CoA carboxylase biotin carboxyl carrier protein
MNENFILTLIDKFTASAITELKLDDGTTSLTLSKNTGDGGQGIGNREWGMGNRESQTENPYSPLPTPHSPSNPETAIKYQPSTTHSEIITSPIVGTFYASAGPDSPAFVSKGAKVTKGQTLCILESMKMMNHLEADFDCEILDIKVSGGELVEFGQPLFEVKKL